MIVVVILAIFEMQSGGEEFGGVGKQICAALMARVEGHANAQIPGKSAAVPAH